MQSGDRLYNSAGLQLVPGASRERHTKATQETIWHGCGDGCGHTGTIRQSINIKLSRGEPKARGHHPQCIATHERQPVHSPNDTTFRIVQYLRSHHRERVDHCPVVR